MLVRSCSNIPQHPSYYLSKMLIEDLELPLFIGRALSAEARVSLESNLDWLIPEEDLKFEQEFLSELKKSLSDDQLELLKALDDLMLKKSTYIMEFMLYSGVKQGIGFYKEYQTI